MSDTPSDIQTLRDDILGYVVASSASGGKATVEKIEPSGDGVEVYVSVEDGVNSVESDAPPQRLNKKMMAHGYGFYRSSIASVVANDHPVFEYVPKDEFEKFR